MKTAAAYIRVSTEEQTEYSPDAQMAEIRIYAASHGFAIPDDLTFIDEGISGKSTGKREAFNRMIGMAKQKPRPFDAILLWKFSRFARNREDSIVYKSMLRKQLGIEVISISEPVGDDKMSILIEAMIEAMDEYYSINLAEEVKRGMTEKARRGGLQSAPPFGFTVRDNVLMPVPEEAGLVRVIFSRFASGEGAFSIARWLNQIGAVTHRGGRFESRTVEYILRNPVYIGKLRWNPAGRTCRDFDNSHIILADARHASVITLELWNTAQQRFRELGDRHTSHLRPLSEHRDWLSGLVRCSACGSTLVFSKPHYWKCNGYAKGTCSCSQHITDEKLKDMILARLEYDTNSGAALSLVPRPGLPDVPEEDRMLLEQQKNLAVRLSRLREAYLSGTESLESYAETKSILERQREDTEQFIRARGAATEKDTAGALLKKSAGCCARLLRDPEADLELKQKMAHNILESCVYSKENNSISLTYRLILSEA